MNFSSSRSVSATAGSWLLLTNIILIFTGLPKLWLIGFSLIGLLLLINSLTWSTLLLTGGYAAIIIVALLVPLPLPATLPALLRLAVTLGIWLLITALITYAILRRSTAGGAPSEN